jgi:non-ribosomal peptide synthetase component F
MLAQPNHNLDSSRPDAGSQKKLGVLALAAPPLPPLRSQAASGGPMLASQQFLIDQTSGQADGPPSIQLFIVRELLQIDALEAALGELIWAHQALRLRLLSHNGKWGQSLGNIGGNAAVLFWHELPGLEERDLQAKVAHLAAEAGRSLDYDHGPMLRIDYLDLGANQPGYLLVTAHRLILDRASWPILMRDLDTAYRNTIGSSTKPLEPSGLSYSDVCSRLTSLETSAKTTRDHWIEFLGQGSPSSFIASERASGPNTLGTQLVETRVLTKAETERFQTALGSHSLEDGILAILGVLHQMEAGTRVPFTVYLEGDPRQWPAGSPFSNTLGNLAYWYPVHIGQSTHSSYASAVRAGAEEKERSPFKGYGFSLFTGNGQSAIAPHALPTFLVRRTFDSDCSSDLFRWVKEMPPTPRASHFGRPVAHELSYGLVDGCLALYWTYSSGQNHPAAIQEKLDAIVSLLRDMGDSHYTESVSAAAVSEAEPVALASAVVSSPVSQSATSPGHDTDARMQSLERSLNAVRVEVRGLAEAISGLISLIWNEKRDQDYTIGAASPSSTEPEAAKAESAPPILAQKAPPIAAPLVSTPVVQPPVIFTTPTLTPTLVEVPEPEPEVAEAPVVELVPQLPEPQTAAGAPFLIFSPKPPEPTPDLPSEPAAEVLVDIPSPPVVAEEIPPLEVPPLPPVFLPQADAASVSVEAPPEVKQLLSPAAIAAAALAARRTEPVPLPTSILPTLELPEVQSEPVIEEQPPVEVDEIEPVAEISPLPIPALALPAVQFSTLHAVVEQMAALQPDQVAIVSGNSSITYRELNESANRLAHFLIGNGVASGDIVGIYLDRSEQMVTAVLAVLKVGAAFLCMDLSFPRERLAYLMEDSGAQLLLSQGRLVGRLPSNAKQHLLIDTMLNALGRMPVTNPAVEVAPDAIAQVNYLSNPAGVPRGVFNTHADIQSHTTSLDCCGPFTSQDTWILLHSLAGESGGIALWGAFLRGARLVITPEQTSQNIRASLQLFRDQSVSVLVLSPPELRELVVTDEPFPKVRVALLSGTPVDANDLREWSAALVEQEAELQVHCVAQLRHPLLTIGTWQPRAARPELANTISRPSEGLQISLLTDDNTVAEVGDSGEICISGPAVDAVLAQHPEVANRVVKDSQGLSLFRSGELASQTADGLQILGSKGDNVLIRSFRVELGEIEALLGARPDVAQCAVIAKCPVPGDVQLHAYLIVAGERKPTQWELRDYLGHYVPDFMTPRAYHFLEEFPQHDDGRLNRKELAKLPRPRW